ncbi:MAG: metal-dependent hydrolase [Sandaracinaceae bacterium]
MASLGHVAVGLAAGRAAGTERPAAAMVGLAALSLLPDADVIGFTLGIPYASTFGHRGASHAILVGLVLGVACAFLVREPRARWRLGLFATLSIVSHGLLDAMTTGGEGVALLWPLTSDRYFFAWRPIPVAPIGAGMLSARGARVLATEALYFAPLLAYALWPRRKKDPA